MTGPSSSSDEMGSSTSEPENPRKMTADQQTTTPSHTPQNVKGGWAHTFGPILNCSFLSLEQPLLLTQSQLNRTTVVTFE
mmetsp:Transcript_24119/g.52049  ORF Transcript_24119/g.52049 Transcript_24119/m.52049 type:complete len:80 (-) Transcript_24119:1192-1431(-)